MLHAIRLAAVLLIAALPATSSGDQVLLLTDAVPADGLVVADVDLGAAARQAGIDHTEALQALAELSNQAESSPRRIPVQFIPGPGETENSAGILLLQLPEGFNGVVRLVPSETDRPAETVEWDGTVSTPYYTLHHYPKKMGGMPCEIRFAGTGKAFEGFRWGDRLHNPGRGSFTLASDAEASAALVSRGPLATVVRTRARYVQGEKVPPSKPHAVYDWHYFHDRPLVFVRGRMEQAAPHAWKEIHFLELNYPRQALPRWAGGEPGKQGKFTGSRDSFGFPDFGAVRDGRNAIAMMRCGQALLYDGGPGTYLQARGDEAWHGFAGTRRETSAWLWIGSAEDPVAAIRESAGNLPALAQVTVTVDGVREAIASARQEVEKLPPEKRRQAWWRVSGAEALEASGRFDESLAVASGEVPETWTVVSAGELGLILERTDGGMRPVDLFDAAEGRHLLAAADLPLFALVLRHVETKAEVKLAADGGWTRCAVSRVEGGEVELRWQGPAEQRLAGLRVTARASPDAAAGAIRWKLRVDGVPAGWTLWDVTFPQLAVDKFGPGAKVLFPRGCGEIKEDAWERSFRFSGTYPSGWTSMQLMAAYDQQSRTGLYVAAHDPAGATKDVLVESRPSESAVVFSLKHPAPGMGTPQNRFELGGSVVWQLFRGDWFDAAMIYREWVRREARWWPKLGAESRPDTPRWMRRLPAWGLGGGGPQGTVGQVKRFQEHLGVPVGFHWYSWHQIPFDNDYPHYFPTKDGFADAVAELQKAGVHVMPYINGRLWDTRDRGVDDCRFSKVALPAATKDVEGKPYIETYGSKESDESRVRLAPMCPATELWQETVGGIVLRLFGECGVDAVYIDQVAAAKPQLCFDPDHGHPIGGGHWWTESYWKLIGRIRESMPEGRALTTECNAEPYVHVFDGYLTWHWQYDGQVPVFPAVYGGAIQMFGRAYRGGPTKDLAFRMKAGQQLVFGEQIGWCSPGVVDETENAEFLRQVVRLRWDLGRYFYVGEMARPPKLLGEIPRVTADWQWHGEWPVTTDAVMTGAWQRPREKRAVLLFVNVGDEPVRATLQFDATDYALPEGGLRATKVTADGRGEAVSRQRRFAQKLDFPPRTAWAWELTE